MPSRASWSAWRSWSWRWCCGGGGGNWCESSCRSFKRSLLMLIRKFMKWRWASVLLAGLAVVFGGCGWSSLPQPAPAAPAAWEKVEPRLRQFDQSADAAANKRLHSVQQFFKQREPGAKQFAGEVLSWSGKWELL